MSTRSGSEFAPDSFVDGNWRGNGWMSARRRIEYLRTRSRGE
jgi:hypothetical protein